MTSESELDARMAGAFTGNYLDATDLKDTGDIELEIVSVTAPGDEKDATGKVIDKAVLRFAKAKKAFIINKTNAKIIALQHGKKPSAWPGKRITLTVCYLEKAFGQQNVPVIRVKPPESSPMTFGMRKNYGSPTPFQGRK